MIRNGGALLTSQAPSVQVPGLDQRREALSAGRLADAGLLGRTLRRLVEPPALPKKKFFAVPEDYHADNFFRLMPLLSAKGVSTSTLRGLADWCETMRPKGNWHALI